MKIAIQGHPTRGKEVIQILESLGAKKTELTGTFPAFYCINNNNQIINEHEKFLRGYKLYTLEEFEKEFPFKVGDKVTVTGTKHPKIITGITDTQWGLRYVISEIKFPIINIKAPIIKLAITRLISDCITASKINLPNPGY